MNKENHTVTVPREYLEKLEEVYEATKDVPKENVIGMITVGLGYERTLLLRENKITGHPDISNIIVIDADGRELMNFKRF